MMRFIRKVKGLRKRVALMLALTLVISVMPGTAYAEEIQYAGLDGFVTIPDVGECLPINADNFPDSKFRAYMIGILQVYGEGVKASLGLSQSPMFEYGGTWYYAKSALPAVTRLSPDNLGIERLDGIEYFTSLEELSVSGNNLTTLDFSSNTKLTALNCIYNKLTTLDISKCTSLTSFACTFNAIKVLDFRGNTVLDPFDASKFNIAFQSVNLTVICDPGSKLEEYCKLYLISYCYNLLKERPKKSVSDQNQVVMVGEKADISAGIKSFAGNVSISKYSVNSKAHATVSKKGLLKGKSAGTVTVTGYTGSGSSKKKAADYNVTVEKAAFSIKKLNSTSKNEIISALNYIKGTEYMPDAFYSSNTDVAEVDAATGLIIVKDKGTAKISALYGEGKNAAKISFKLKVEIPSLNKTKLYLKTGKSAKLKLKGTKERAVFRSSDEGRVIVGESTGEISAVSKGSAVVTAYLNGVGYECVVIVV